MTLRWIVGGCLVTLVGLGFVFPQLEEIRLNGSLALGGICLLLLGVAAVLGGLGCFAHGIRQSLESR